MAPGPCVSRRAEKGAKLLIFTSFANSHVDSAKKCGTIWRRLHSNSIFGEPDVPAEIGRSYRALTR